MVPAIRRIAVGVGLLGRWDPVLNVALGLAKELQAELHAVHVYDPPHPLDVAYAQRSGRGGAALEDRAAGLARLLDAQVRAIDEAPRAICHLREGTPCEGIVQVAEQVEADMVIVGATRHDRLSRRFLGSTAHGVISAAVAPVLLLRQPIVRPLKRVLVTTNLSDVSSAICRKAFDLVRRLSTSDQPQVRCLLVLHRQSGANSTPPADPLLEFAREELARFLGEHPCALGPVQERIRAGEPAEEIVEEAAAWSPDLLIVGNHGYAGRIHGMGSVTGQALREVVCNTVVIPAIQAPAAQMHRKVGVELQTGHAQLAGSVEGG